MKHTETDTKDCDHSHLGMLTSQLAMNKFLWGGDSFQLKCINQR